MKLPLEAAKRYREEAAVWRRVAQAVPDVRGRTYWERLADDYAKLADDLERRVTGDAEAAE
jgi:predicted helicase